MKKLLVFLFLLVPAAFGARAQSADTLLVQNDKKSKLINDYLLIGVNYGVSFSNM